MTVSGLDLVLEAKAGNSRAFGELYDRHVREIFDFCYYRVSRKEVAEDLTSVVFMKALENLPHFTPTNDASFRGWLYTIARHAIIDHYRRTKQTDDVDGLPLADSKSTSFVDDLDTAIDRTRLRDALAALSESEQEIITMRVWQELPYSVIAASLGKSEDATKMQFSRALRKLKTAAMTLTAIALIILKKFYF